jgi:ketosteroid isomerase-like protein
VVNPPEGQSVSREPILRSLYAAFNEDDSETLAALVTDDVVVHLLPNDLIPATTLRGRAELIANHEKNLAATQLKQHVLSVSEHGPFATVYIEAVGNDRVGSERRFQCADLLRFDGDRICEVVGLVA